MFVFSGCCVLFQVEASATNRSLVQGTPTECVSLCMIKGNNDPLHQQWVRQNDVGLYKINYIGLTIYI